MQNEKKAYITRQTNEEQSIDIKQMLFTALHYWYLFVIAVAVALVAGFFVNRYSTKVYQTSGTILIKEGRSGYDATSIMTSNSFGNSQNIDNELAILRSYTLTERVVKKMGIEVTYMEKGRVSMVEMYKTSPFLVEFERSVPQAVGLSYEVTLSDDDKIQLHAIGEGFTKYDFIICQQTESHPYDKIDISFDMQGKGTLTWTGCIPHGYFSIVHKTGYYDDVVSEMWVENVNTGEYSVQNMIDDNPNYDTILLDEGYYTITLDTRTMNLSIEPSDPNVPAYGSVVLVGYFNNWNNEANPMDGVNTRLGLNNHDWWLGEWTQTKTGYEGDVKFCLYGSWDYDWGTNTFPFGTGVQGGQNIPAKKGTYYVFLNDITGQYHFIKK